jgi:uncharacterized membrane protein YcaP (DUF421 family)
VIFGHGHEIPSQLDPLILVPGPAVDDPQLLERRVADALDDHPGRETDLMLVANGRVLEASLRRQRMTTEELLAEARQQSIGSLDDIEYAVLETNGCLSFLKRDDR